MAGGVALVVPKTIIDMNPASYRDDWGRLQAMIDQAAWTGQELTVANGEYRLSQPLILRSGLTLLNNMFVSDDPSGIVVRFAQPIIGKTILMTGNIFTWSERASNSIVEHRWNSEYLT